MKKSNTPPWETGSYAAILELMSGNEDATRFMQIIGEWSHIYDDLIDKDKNVNDDKIHWVMWELLVNLQLNSFFTTYSSFLIPVIMTGILNWHAANEIEKNGNLEELRVSHSLRYSISDVGLMAMLLASGKEFADKNAKRARLMFQYDTWEHYKSEHYKGNENV